MHSLRDRSGTDYGAGAFRLLQQQRANVVRLGEACTEPAGDRALCWAELRRVSLLKDRSDRYPLQVGSVDEYRIFKRNVPPSTLVQGHM